MAVVLVHTANTTLATYETDIGQFEEFALISIRFLAYFGTPTFIFISELLLANAYPKEVPKGFFMKRIRFLLLPFVFMAFIFAVIISSSIFETMENFFLHLIGGYTGYFILVIFQFYILHYLFNQLLDKWSPKVVILFSFIINAAYLAFFNFTEAPQTLIGEYIWLRGYWIPFLGWIFYFTVGYYVGKNYQIVKSALYQYRKLIYPLPILFLSVILILTRVEILEVVSSKRIDYLFYTVSMVFLIILITSQVKKVPNIIYVISKYSFNIYLLHKVILHYLPSATILHPLIYSIIAFLIAVSGTIIIANILSRFHISQFLIGKTIPIPKQGK